MHRRVEFVCKMTHFLLERDIYILIRGQLGFQCVLVIGWGESIKFHGKLGFSHHLQ